jgi:hypothetical protein
LFRFIFYFLAFVHCWIADYPKGCTHDPAVECTRGDGQLALVLGWLLYYIPVWVCGFGIATVSMTLVYFHVRQTEKASQKYSMSMHSNVRRTDFSGSIQGVDATNAAEVVKEKREKLKLSQRVAVQGLWYLGAFYITWFWPTVTTIFESVGIYKYWILVLLAITLPLQGFLNWIIYIRPRLLRYMNKHPEWNIFYAMFRAVSRACLKQKDDDDLSETKLNHPSSRNASSANGGNGSSQLVLESPRTGTGGMVRILPHTSSTTTNGISGAGYGVSPLEDSPRRTVRIPPHISAMDSIVLPRME